MSESSSSYTPSYQWYHNQCVCPTCPFFELPPRWLGWCRKSANFVPLWTQWGFRIYLCIVMKPWHDGQPIYCCSYYITTSLHQWTLILLSIFSSLSFSSIAAGIKLYCTCIAPHGHEGFAVLKIHYPVIIMNKSFSSLHTTNLNQPKVGSTTNWTLAKKIQLESARYDDRLHRRRRLHNHCESCSESTTCKPMVWCILLPSLHRKKNNLKH